MSCGRNDTYTASFRQGALLLVFTPPRLLGGRGHGSACVVCRLTRIQFTMKMVLPVCLFLVPTLFRTVAQQELPGQRHTVVKKPTVAPGI